MDVRMREWCLQRADSLLKKYEEHEDAVLQESIADAFAPTITKLVEAARNFAARVEERNPEWFREEKGTTDFSEADHALRAALAELEKP